MSKQDEKKLYEQQEEKILVQSDAFISLLTKRGILADQKIDSEKVRSAKQEKTKNSYHNTFMLQQQYCTSVWMMEWLCADESMEPTLERGSYIIGCRIYSNLETGDIIIFRHNRKLLVKRIVAVEGDMV